jgi:hypothetical protein
MSLLTARTLRIATHTTNRSAGPRGKKARWHSELLLSRRRLNRIDLLAQVMTSYLLHGI